MRLLQCLVYITLLLWIEHIKAGKKKSTERRPKSSSTNTTPAPLPNDNPSTSKAIKTSTPDRQYPRAVNSIVVPPNTRVSELQPGKLRSVTHSEGLTRSEISLGLSRKRGEKPLHSSVAVLSTRHVADPPRMIRQSATHTDLHIQIPANMRKHAAKFAPSVPSTAEPYLVESKNGRSVKIHYDPNVHKLVQSQKWHSDTHVTQVYQTHPAWSPPASREPSPSSEGRTSRSSSLSSDSGSSLHSRFAIEPSQVKTPPIPAYKTESVKLEYRGRRVPVRQVI